MAKSKQPPPVSPFSTGGGGTNFELKVAVAYVAGLLTGKTARGSDGMVRAVSLQQRNRGKAVDDIIVVFNQASGEGEVSLQAKHSLRFTTGDADFSDALQQCWRQFRREDFDDLRHRIGIAFGEASNIQKVRDNVPELLEWARTSESAEAFVEKAYAINAKKELVETFREVLGRVAGHPIRNTDLWRFLKVFVALPFDFTGTAARDRLDIIDALRQIVPNGAIESAVGLADGLFSIASEFAKSAGEITLDTLLPLIPADVRARLPSVVTQNARSIGNRLADHVRRQLTKQVNSRKYIPYLFVEANKVKDAARLFCNPVRFFGRAIATLQRLNLSRINAMCRDFRLAEVRVELPRGFAVPTDIRDVANGCILMQQLCRDLGNLLQRLERTPAGDNLTEHERYLLAHKWHSTGAWSLKFHLQDALRQFDYLQGGVLLLLSPAGQGKTNFICDLADLTLLYGTPAVFFTGKSLESISIANLEDHIWSIADPGPTSKSEKIERLRQLCHDKNMPFVVLIDAINEHNNLPAFASSLELCIEQLMALGFVRVVLTCRSEFFDARFRNLRGGSFARHLREIDRLHERMEPVQRGRMVRRYFEFYKLRPAVSGMARKKLTRDPFLLRIFCEAYGDPKGANEIAVPYLADIYRDRLFTDYLTKRLDELVQRRRERGGALLGEQRHYVEPLMGLVGMMVESRNFSSVAVDQIAREHIEPLDELLAEEIIIRKDLSPVPGGEVVAFPFDELRDFLIARYLVDVTLRGDEQAFLRETRELLRANHPITEGVSRFLFFAAKRSGATGLHQLVKDEQWFKDSFLEAILAIEDDLIDDADIAELRRRFLGGVSKITIALIHRYDCTAYKRLNIRTLFALLDELSIDQFETFVVPVFEGSYSRGAVWPIERLSRNIVEVIAKLGTEEVFRFAPLVELLFYLLPIRGAEYEYPARVALMSILVERPELANSIFVAKVKDLSLIFGPYHWDLAADFVRSGHQPPKGMLEAAVRLWRSLPKDEGQVRARLADFFIAAAESKPCKVPKAVLAEVQTQHRQRMRQWLRQF